MEEEPEPPAPEPRPPIRSNRAASSNQLPESPRRELPNYELAQSRPMYGRSTTFEGPTQLHRDSSPVSATRMSRVPSDNLTMRTQRAQLRPITHAVTGNELLEDPSDASIVQSNGSPDRYFGERSASPATSYGSAPSRTASSSTLNAMTPNAMTQSSKKQPPPPPPSRTKKPPPPPPMKRSALSTSDVHYA